MEDGSDWEPPSGESGLDESDSSLGGGRGGRGAPAGRRAQQRKRPAGAKAAAKRPGKRAKSAGGGRSAAAAVAAKPAAAAAKPAAAKPAAAKPAAAKPAAAKPKSKPKAKPKPKPRQPKQQPKPKPKPKPKQQPQQAEEHSLLGNVARAVLKWVPWAGPAGDVPGAPGAPTLHATSASSLTVAWAPPAADAKPECVDAYRLERRRADASDEWTVVAADVRRCRKAVRRVRAGEAYYFRVFAHGPGGWGAPSPLSGALRLPVPAARPPPPAGQSTTVPFDPAALSAAAAAAAAADDDDQPTLPQAPPPGPGPNNVNNDEDDVDLDDIRFDEPRVLLGQGGFGTVYRSAVGGWRGTTVAVKLLHIDAAGVDVTAELLNEVALLRRVRHPHLVMCMGACFRPPTLFVVTEYMAGGDLAHLLHRSRRRLAHAALTRLARQVCSGMVYLHTSRPPIVHRDLKAQNVLLDDALNAKVCDFGLARSSSRTSIATAHAGAGTPRYMAPEVLRSERITPAVDVFAFGVLLWELFTRRVPWRGLKYHEIVRRVALERAALPPDPAVPAEVAALVRDCCSHAAEGRPGFEEVLGRLGP